MSLLGLPPLAGFAGKFQVFASLWAASRDAASANLGTFYAVLLGIGALNTAMSAYYYLRIVILMYMVDGEPEVHRARMLSWTAGVSAVGTVVLTIFAAPLFAWAAGSVLNLFR